MFAGLTVATAALVGGASVIATDRQVIAEVDKFLRDRAEEIVNGAREQPRDRRDRNPTGVSIAFDPDSEVQIIDKNGAIASNSGLTLPVQTADLALVDDDGPARLRTVPIDGDDYRLITDHLPGGGAVQVARSLDESSSLLSRLQRQSLEVALGLAVIGAGLGWVVAQRTTRPLRALSEAVDAVAETQDFTVPVSASGDDEVGRLAAGFDRMLGALHLSREQQRRLVQDAAHELRTPLTSITANVDWLLHASDLPAEERVETLAGIRQEVGELNEVIGEIIELATDSHQEAELVPLDLVDLVEDTVDRFRRRAGRTVTVRSTPVTVRGDADALARALSNLLRNADKYSSPGLPIEVVVGPDGVFVDDAGPGIPAEERALVFERFYRRDVDRSQPGSGLGLSIVVGIVEAHGGSVVADDAPTGGARVGFRLPTI